MKSTRACALFAMLSFACARELDLPVAPSSTGFFSGRAVEPIAGTDQVQPVSGAEISAPGTNLHAVSDSQGGFTLGPLPTGTYRLLFTLRGANGAVRQRLLSGAQIQRGGATALLGEVALHQNAQVAGRALLNGAARGNAGISVFVPGTDFVNATADTGAYTLRDLPEGTVRIAAFRQGYVGTATTDLQVQGGALTTAVDLVLLPQEANPAPGSLTGTVAVLGDGVPSQVQVKAFRGNAASAAASVPVAADGSFALAGLAPDLYRLELSLAGYPSAELPNLLVAAGVALKLNDAIVLSPFTGASNVPFDAGVPDQPDAGPDAGTPDAGTPDAGGIGAECNTDLDCASGRLCVGQRCIGCDSNVSCRAGFECRGGDCVRPCQSNSECAQGLVCTAGVCGQCQSSADCGSAALVCLAGSCGHCRSGADCASGRACLATGCGSCTQDAQCDSGQLCDLGVCKPGQCHDNSGCAPTQRCDAQTLTCTSCTADNQCSAGRLCLNSACTVADCRQNGDCGPGQACLGNLCGACSGKSSCAATQVCDNGACTTGDCTSSADCGNQICVNHFCSACNTSDQCGAGKVCSNHACVSGNCVSAATDCAQGQICQANNCANCVVKTDCAASGYVCDNGACTPGTCLSEADCDAGQLCGANHLCIGCSATAPCGNGFVCAAGLCKPGNCLTAATCAQGQICQNHYCSSCVTKTDCGASGFVCNNGACEAGTCLTAGECAQGQLCNAAHQCVGCQNNGECGSGFVCAGGLCKAGNCVTAATCGGQLCVNNNCTACSANTDCGASGYVCVGGGCTPGTCVNESQCQVQGQLCNASHQCVNCNTSAECGTNRVCDTGLCVGGTCAATSDCKTSGSYDGRVCVAHNCTACSSDTQCPSGDRCYAGQCLPGDCKVNADCGQRVCNQATHFCQNCAPLAGQSTCPSGYLCDAAGLCEFGSCVQSSDCVGPNAGKVCQNYQCVACTAQTEALCPVAAPICSATTALCVAGNCHTTPDCNATHNVCVGNTCTGNCQTNTDCQSGSSNPYCNPATHQCAPCTASSQCGTGYVCTASSGGACVAGSCSFDVGCQAALGQSCVANQCQQTAPAGGALPGGGSPITNPETATNGNSQPAVLSGKLGLYYSYGPSTGAQTEVALDAADLKHTRWRNQETGSRIPFEGIVIPAPGFTSGELFLAGDNNNWTARLGSDGTLAWKQAMGAAQGALGLAGSGSAAVLTLASYQQGSPYSALLLRADGTGGQRSINVGGGTCTMVGTPVWGRSYVYFFCSDGITAVDPVLNTMAWKLGFPPGSGTAGGTVTSPAIWRPQGATQETLYFAASPAATGLKEWSLTVTDTMVQNHLSPAGYIQGPTVTTDGINSYTQTMLDTSDLSGAAAPRVVFAKSGNPGTMSVVDGVGNLIAQVSTPFTSGDVMLASDGSIVGINGTTFNNGLLTGIRITPNAATPTAAVVTTLWTLPLTPAGNWQTFAYPTAVATPGTTLGNLLIWGQPANQSTPSLNELTPGSNAASFLAAAPAWPWFGGDPGGHRVAPSFECTSNSGCAADQTCLLGRCVGQCQTATDCNAKGFTGSGCVMGQCQACVADASCAAGQRCTQGICYTPQSGGGSCSVDADCNSSSLICMRASCVQKTQRTASTQSPLTLGFPSAFTVGTDGTPYSILFNTGNDQVQAWDPATLNGPYLTPLPGFAQMSLPAGTATVNPVPLITRLGANAYDTLFLSGGVQSTALYSFSGPGAPAMGGTNFVQRTAFDGQGNATQFFSGGLTLGISRAKDGVTPRPTLFSYYANNKIFALDAQDATSGSGNLTALWSAPTLGADNGNLQPLPILVGSDGTLYHFKTNGKVQAWDPNGDPTSTRVNGTLSGKLLWEFTAATPWSGNVGVRPAIANVAPGVDRLYFCAQYSGNPLMTLDVSGAALPQQAALQQTALSCGTTLDAPVVVDTDGYVLFAANNLLTLMAPDRSIASQLTNSFGGAWFNNGANVTLGDDGIAYVIGQGPISGAELIAVQISPTHQLSLLWEVEDQTTPFDTFSFPVMVPGNGSGVPGHMLIDYYVSGNSGPRFWSAFGLGTTHGPKPGAWSMWGGDQQHRNSLKTQ